MQKRVETCEWITDMIEDVPDFLTNKFGFWMKHISTSPGMSTWRTMSTWKASLPTWSATASPLGEVHSVGTG